MRDYVQTSAEGRVGVVGCTEMCAQVQRAARIRDGHLEPARSGDADDSEGAEADSASPRRRCLHARGLFGLGNSLGLGLLDLDLERTELVVTSKVSMVLQERGGGSHACRRGEGVQLEAREAPRLRMWFNGWLCDLAAAACGRGKLHVRLLWPGHKGRVSVLAG